MAAQKRFCPAVNPSRSDFPTMDCDVLTTEECSGSDDEEESLGAESGMSSAFNSYWNAAMQKPTNFNLWTKLIAYAEHERNLAACRKAYDEFLLHFPYCHTYWKKYTDLEQHYGNREEAEKVFDRAVKASPLNVTMWVHYIRFLKGIMDMTLTKSVDKLRGMFKEAIKASGMEFHSDELWKMDIQFETQQNNLKDVTALYDQVLTIPTLQYRTHYERFKVFAVSHSPTEILTTEELDWIHSKIQAESEDYYQIAAEDSDDYVASLTESDIAKIREHLLKVREQLFLLNEVEVKKRWTFEENIKRLYFYAVPLNIKQLQNWKKYLEFEVAQGQHERIVLLYERCLMTCVLYEEFWLSYAQYMEGHSVEDARSVFERACRIHLPLKYSLHLQWAAFEEKHGCLDSAQAILCHLENAIPSLAIVRLRRVGLERRSGNLQEAERLLKEAVQMSSGTKMAGFYAVKLSRLLLKLQKDQQKATAVLKDALKKDPDNPMLHICMLENEMSRDNTEDAPLVYVEQALKSKLSNNSKMILSQRRLEFLEDFGNSLTSWFDAYNEHQTYLRKGDDGKKDDQKVTTGSVSQDCHPPGVSPPPKTLKSGVSPENVFTNNASSTTNVSVARNSSIASSSKTSGPPTSEPSSHYRRPPLLGPYFPGPRTYGPPQNVTMQPFFRNRFAPPRENMYQDFNQSMPLNTPQGPFNGPPFMDNSGMPFGMPPIFGYGPWFQNFGPWNRFFPPQ